MVFFLALELQAQQARISSLYLPLIVIIMENINRLQVIAPTSPSEVKSPPKQAPPPPPMRSKASHHMASSSVHLPGTPNKRATISLDMRALSADSSPVKHVTIRDSNYLSIIAGSSPANRDSLHCGQTNGSCGAGSQESVISTSTLSEQTEHDSTRNGSMKECTDSDSVTTDSLTRQKQGHSRFGRSFGHLNRSVIWWYGWHYRCSKYCDCRSASMPFAAQGHPVRYDKFDQSEVKDLLVCFLYTVKNTNEGRY